MGLADSAFTLALAAVLLWLVLLLLVDHVVRKAVVTEASEERGSVHYLLQHRVSLFVCAAAVVLILAGAVQQRAWLQWRAFLLGAAEGRCAPAAGSGGSSSSGSSSSWVAPRGPELRGAWMPAMTNSSSKLAGVLP
jgi:hypothetical protein